MLKKEVNKMLSGRVSRKTTAVPEPKIKKDILCTVFNSVTLVKHRYKMLVISS